MSTTSPTSRPACARAATRPASLVSVFIRLTGRPRLRGRPRAGRVPNSPNRLTGNRGDDLEVPVVTEHDQAFPLRGRGDEQVDWPGRAMLAAFGERLLDFIRTLVRAVAHRNPAEYRLEHPPLLGPVRARPGRAEELKLDDRAGRDDARSQLVSPRLAMPLLEDAEKARGVNEVESRGHRR